MNDWESVPTENIVALVVMLGMALGLMWLAMRAVRGMFRKRPPPDKLDHVLFTWNGVDKFTLRILLEGIAVFGRTGSGKTSGSLRLLARFILRYMTSGGL